MPITQDRILVVDDSVSTLKVLERNLASQGYAVLTAPSVSQAIDQRLPAAVEIIDALARDDQLAQSRACALRFGFVAIGRKAKQSLEVGANVRVRDLRIEPGRSVG